MTYKFQIVKAKHSPKNRNILAVTFFALVWIINCLLAFRPPVNNPDVVILLIFFTVVCYVVFLLLYINKLNPIGIFQAENSAFQITTDQVNKKIDLKDIEQILMKGATGRGKFPETAATYVVTFTLKNEESITLHLTRKLIKEKTKKMSFFRNNDIDLFKLMSSKGLKWKFGAVNEADCIN